jgi:DNA topoisomerase-2
MSAVSASSKKSSAEAQRLAATYQMKSSQRQHVLDIPDTYIGSIEPNDTNAWVFNAATSQMEWREIQFIPGLYKLFDEAIVNCRDHVIRMIQQPDTEDNSKRLVTHIKVDIDPATGTITMENDGNGIDVAKHPEHNIWIPEMIFARYLSGTNYQAGEERTVGGKNGYGVKLIFTWSTYGRLETVDHVRKLHYVQEFHQNLEKIDPPTITKLTTKSPKPFTKITFRPDYARLKLAGLSPDTIALMHKRVYDIAAVSDHSVKKISVALNGGTLPVKTFKDYVKLFVGADAPIVYESSHERWEYAVAAAPSALNQFSHVSFVNGIATYVGGKHVDYIIGQITRKLSEHIEKQSKGKMKPSAGTIKDQLILFLRCDIVNPSFDSQSKVNLNTPQSKFGSSAEVSDTFIKKVAKDLGIVDTIFALTEAKENRMAKKKADGSKTRRIHGVENLEDANWSGTSKSAECTLILCEGKSAMAGIMSGLSSEDKNRIGIYPLRGKLLNVRGLSSLKIAENKEIADIIKILGLELGREYKSAEEVQQRLRYGKVMFMTDQDLDGSHIKGLCINMFHSVWRTLVQVPGFLSFMNTPILRATKGQRTINFYNDGELNTWKQGLSETERRSWKMKYYKGLGTSNSADFKEYFADMKQVKFICDQSTDDVIDKIFNKSRADERKLWIENGNRESFLDTSRPEVTYNDFVDKELIHFSTYDCARSLPSSVDGLKISLRKILFCAFKRRLTAEIKVAQFSGYVSEHSAYHHGEASLNGAIVNMAQTFVGSNNINLLEPQGQFGTRIFGGEDSASERYIFTHLNHITRFLFREEDDAILKYLEDDGVPVEPEYYVPVIPLALINGVQGIGTGFSCSIPPYNPLEIIQYIRGKQQNQDVSPDFVPYYEGFKGRVEKIADHKYLVRGCYTRTPNSASITITELPVGTWTKPYEKVLEKLLDAGDIRDFTSLSTESVVNIHVQFSSIAVLDKLESQSHPVNSANREIVVNGLEKSLELTTTVSSTNIHMFNSEGKLHKYTDAAEIVEEFSRVRIATYEKRRLAMIDTLRSELLRLTNHAAYIVKVLEGTIDLRRKTAAQVEELLLSQGLAKIDGQYNYLTKLPMDSVSAENVETLLKKKGDKEQELQRMQRITPREMWRVELDELEREYTKFRARRAAIVAKTSASATEGKKKPVVIRKPSSK